MNPLDRNHDGKVDLKDLSGRQTTAQPGLMNQNGLAQPAHMNPLDRNHDGRVDLKDLSGRQTQPGMIGQPGMVGQHNPLDRNHDGRVDARDLSGNQTGIVHNGLGLAPGMMQTSTTTTTTQSLPIGHHNPLDRNHDGRVDARDLAVGQTTYIQSAQRASLTRAEPTIIETIQKDVVIQERIHPVQKEEIQPIIYREREQLDVKQVTQMMHETQIQPTIIHQRELPAERREAIIERGAPIAENYVAASREVDATLRTQVVHAPIVNEVIKKTIIEEIQPVLERDIITSTVIQNTQPIYEKIVEAPTVYREIVTVQDRGFVGADLAALEAQGFNLGAAGRRLSQGYTSAPLAGGLVQPGMMMNQNGLAHHNPLDRNHDGRVDMHDLSGRQTTGLAQPGMMGQTGLVGEPLVSHRGLTSANPLDRNHDGRVDMHDLSGRQTTGIAQPGMMGQTGLAQPAHMNPLDRNHDGKVDLKDLTGKPSATTANRPVNLL